MPNSVINRRIKKKGPSYDPYAQAYFDAIPSFPELAKPIYNRLIKKAFVDTGLLAQANFRALLCPPSNNHDERFTELKTLTKVTEPFASNGVPVPSPYLTNNNLATNSKGYKINGSTPYIDTGWIASVLQTYSSHANIFLTYRAIPAAVGRYLAGAFQSPKSNLMCPRFTGNRIQMDSSQLGNLDPAIATGEAGRYIMNRQSDIDAAEWVNGVKVYTLNSNGGGLTTIPDFLGNYNNNGVPGVTFASSEIPAYIKLPLGVPDAIVQIVDAELAIWQNDMGYIEGVQDKLVVFHGNSHLVMWRGQSVERFALKVSTKKWQIENKGVSAQTTTQMIANGAAQVDVFYNVSYSKNIVLVNEVQNDCFFNGFANALTRLATYCLDRVAAGFSPVVAQIGTRPAAGNFNGYTQQQFDLAVDLINVTMASGYLAYAVRMVPVPSPFFDYRSNPIYTSDADYTAAMAARRANTMYYQAADQLHYTKLGSEIWGDAYTVEIEAV